ncbi:MAG: hypothetical protein ACR2QW_06410 [bacterium]
MSGCIGISYTHTNAGGGHDANSCITLQVDDANGQSENTNDCGSEINLLEFSTGSRGLFTVPANSTIQRQETIGAWGACIVPSVPRCTGDFEYYCD